MVVRRGLVVTDSEGGMEMCEKGGKWEMEEVFKYHAVGLVLNSARMRDGSEWV